MGVRVAKRKRGWAMTFCVTVLRRPLLLLTKRDWRGAEHLPARVAASSSANHVSEFDPVPFAHFVYDNGRLPRFLGKAEVFKVPVVGRILTQRRTDPRLPQERRCREGVLVPRSPPCEKGECVIVYPEGTISPGPGSVADGRQVRGRTDRADHRVPGDPVRAVGTAGDPRAVRPPAAPVSPQADADQRRQHRSTCRTCRARRMTPDGAARGDRPDHGSDHRRCSRTSAARRRRSYATTRASHGVADIGNPNDPRNKTVASPPTPKSEGDAREQGRRLRLRLVGDGLLAWCSPTPATTSSCGRAARSSARRSTTSTRTSTTCPGVELSPAIRATHDPEEALADASSRRTRGSVAVVARQPRALGRAHPRRCRADEPDEGRRGRHRQADERGHRGGRPASATTGSPC